MAKKIGTRVDRFLVLKRVDQTHKVYCPS